MKEEPIYASKRLARNLWQQYRIYRDRLELEVRPLFCVIVVRAEDVCALEIRPSIFGGWKGITWGIKIDNCDLFRHVLLTKKSGFVRRIGFTPDEPERFVAMGREIPRAAGA